MSRAASNHDNATGPVNGCFFSDESLGSDDIADTIGEENKSSGYDTLGVATDVVDRHLWRGTTMLPTDEAHFER